MILNKSEFYLQYTDVLNVDALNNLLNATISFEDKITDPSSKAQMFAIKPGLTYRKSSLLYEEDIPEYKAMFKDILRASAFICVKNACFLKPPRSHCDADHRPASIRERVPHHDRVITLRAGGQQRHRRLHQFLDAADILDRLRRQIGPGSRTVR